MNIATLAMPRMHGPGLAWLPAVWRQRATWRTVWRFLWLGPLIGGAPYVVFIVPIPFAYFIGAAPALIAGVLFATWYHGHAGRPPSWPWRALLGALSGAAAAAASALYFELAAAGPQWFMVGVIAVHGIPAAVILALLKTPPAADAPSLSAAQPFVGGEINGIAPSPLPPSSPVRV